MVFEMRIAVFPTVFSNGRAARQLAILGLVLSLSIGLTTGLSQAQNAAGGDTLAPFEQTLFSRDYTGDPMADRLNRLESSVFGGTQGGSDVERQARLVKALSAAQEVIPTAPGKKGDDSSDDNAPSTGINRFTAPGSSNAANSGDDGSDADSGNSSAKYAAPKGDSDYPSVTALEREVFGRDFVREDVTHRLDRLEKRAFGQASPQIALSDRVDRLMAMYPNAATAVSQYTRAASGAAADGAAGSSIRDLPSNSSQFVGSQDSYTKISALERKLFNGKTYGGELLTQRLTRLETKAYGRSYAGQNVDARINRLMSAYRVPVQAHPSQTGLMTQPDPAKWQDPESVGYTGSFLSQNRGRSYSAPASSASSAPQNIQIGSGFSSSSTSSSGYGFSPEMMSMLPPSMQQQLAGNATSVQQQQSSNTVIGAPGTVVTQQSTTYPGFQTYNGQPIQTYSYYGNPAIQTQSSTTVIQPNGSQMGNGSVTFNSTQSGTMTNPYGLPTPVYTGDPMVLQNLGNLEINLFGQVDMVDVVPVRMARLESMLLHQVYPSLPDAQRVANLQKAYQMQSVGRMMGNSKAANIGRAAGSMLFGVPLGNTAAPGVMQYNGVPGTTMPYGAYPGVYPGMPTTTQVIMPTH